MHFTEHIEIDKLRVNKNEYKRQREVNAKQFDEIEILDTNKVKDEIEHTELVLTDYLSKLVNEAESKTRREIFSHLLIVGDEGSGKMSFLKSLQSQRFIVVTLEETFDSKNLVGTYVCNETGEFVFKKGPLTVAAEEGMWLVLRNIEKCPPDLLSFLLPLTIENKLKVTSSFEITPKLGFRIVALSSQPRIVKEKTSISPFTQNLHTIFLD